MLTQRELEHYSRQIRLDNFGIEAQEKLKAAKVLVIGAGALGCPVLQYLVAAGVGQVGIVDGDKIEISNLHRQVMYTENDLGEWKVEAAEHRLHAMNSFVSIEVFRNFLSSENAIGISQNYDIIVDGTDNFPTRYLVNDLCVFTNKINVHGSIQQYTGQVSVFNFLFETGERGPNYRDLYQYPPNPSEVVSCTEGGVIGALPGIIGSIMAMEVIKVITGQGVPLAGKILTYDSLTHQSQMLKFGKDPENPISGDNPSQTELIDYHEFCGVKKEHKMKEISVQELKQWMDNKEDFQLIDVREIFEYDQSNMNGELIPMGEIPERFSEIVKDKNVVVHCKMGGRSANVIQYLEQTHGFNNLHNLRGGIIAWAQEIDPSLLV
jgi:molybdopterin/thiamine biosynthesis adenylyltransferase/rhodanese-related sulfurtransferase